MCLNICDNTVCIVVVYVLMCACVVEMLVGGYGLVRVCVVDQLISELK